MPIHRTTDEELQRGQSRLDAVFREMEREQQQRPPKLVNLAPTVAVEAGDRFRFRGRRYHVRHLPWLAGLRLLFLQTKLSEATERAKDRTLDAPFMLDLEREWAEGVRLMWQHAEPIDAWDRLTKRWRSNGFGNMTLGEGAALLGFFSDCRMRRERLEFES